MNKKVTYNLLAGYFSGNCSESEKQQVENWKNSSPDNLNEFNQIRAMWENAQKPADAFIPDIESALNDVNKKLTFIPNDRTINKGKLFITYTRRIAAAILIGAGIWFSYTLFRTKPESSMLIAESSDIRKEMILSDGTHIWLNKNSMLRYPETFKGSLRKVYLEGEAYFEVAKNAEKSFVIETGQSVVTVVGTEFNLRARNNEELTIVTVAEGKVMFTGKDDKKSNPIYLTAGDKGLLNASSKIITLEKNQDPNFLAWKTGKLVFKNTPLDKVASDLSSYFNTNVIIEDSSITKIPFTSTFNNQKLSDIITILKLSLGIQADSTKRGFILK